MRLFLLSLLLSLPAFAKSSVTIEAGEEVCAKVEIQRLLGRTKFRKLIVDKILDQSRWGYYPYQATLSDTGERMTGEIYLSFRETADRIHCELNYRPSWIWNPTYVFTLRDDRGSQVAGRMAEIRVKGKRFRF